MKRNYNAKTSSKLVILLCIFIVSCVLSSCSETSSGTSIEGEYTGTHGSFLKLNPDGECIYAEKDDTGTGEGTWRVEDDTIYIDVENLRYELFGDISDFDGGFMLEADSDSWREEYFNQKK